MPLEQIENVMRILEERKKDEKVVEEHAVERSPQEAANHTFACAGPKSSSLC